ncbi:hypothetical protein DFH08DRAFT_440460 [Mycena albidolilacea]|uniref:Protein kinase domain-containing protein n=1 Tax=Mycena albidolilacea TaxID=1033008 RepID=A0AAD7AH52_9AGAR|nr:hypothetical protein DFH08DRAFT_440460 [Mycena albidolilacea]
MDLQPSSDPEFTIVSPANVQSALHPGAFFPNAAGFTIGGGVFTSNVTNHVHSPPQELTAFRTILMGDIKLVKELRVNDESGVVGRQNRDARVRRMYSAKVMGGETGRMTVAMYQGARVEEDTLQEWRQHLTIYESLRHPNVMQLYGLANTSRLRAMVFYDDLIHFDQFIGRFRHSPILTLYIYSYCTSEYDAVGYFFSVSPPRIGTVNDSDGVALPSLTSNHRVLSTSHTGYAPKVGSSVWISSRVTQEASILCRSPINHPDWRNYHWTTLTQRL